LKQFPADYVKIDGSFIAHLDKNPIDQVLVRSITEVARALGKKTVAEFIENEAVLNLVREIGIDFAQGYYIARPSPIEKLDLSAGTAAIANL
jgi:EAL domain-containing protein (putative c-di-GMP-specific phosphodiesterase class I)